MLVLCALEMHDIKFLISQPTFAPTLRASTYATVLDGIAWANVVDLFCGAEGAFAPDGTWLRIVNARWSLSARASPTYFTLAADWYICAQSAGSDESLGMGIAASCLLASK